MIARVKTDDVLEDVTPPSRLQLSWSQRSSDMLGSRHRAAFDRGLKLALRGQHGKALSAFREAAKLRPDFAEAFCAIGWILAETGQLQEAIAVCDDLVDRFDTAGDLPLRRLVAKALSNKGLILGALDHNEDAIAVYDELVNRFGTATELPLREEVAKALFHKGVTLGGLGRSEDVSVYDELVNRFGTATEPLLREAVAKALSNKGVILGMLGRYEDAIAIYDELVNRFGTATELPLREAVARAFVNKGSFLDDLGRHEEAIAVYSELANRFGTATEPPLREAVSAALSNKEIARQKSDLVSDNTMQDNPVPGATITPRGEPGSPGARQRLPVREARHELTRSAQTEWPSEKWLKSKEHVSRRKLSILKFLDRVWVPFIEKTGILVTIPMLKSRDEDAAAALRSARRYGRQPQDQIPIYTGTELKNMAESGRPVQIAQPRSDRIPDMR